MSSYKREMNLKELDNYLKEEVIEEPFECITES